MSEEKRHVIVSIDIGVKNLGWSIFASAQSFKTTLKQPLEQLSITFGIFNITETVRADQSIVTERCKAVKTFMQHIANNFVIDYVIIERQVVTNTKAMELMYAITMAAHCYTDNSNDVIIFDPKLKFTLLKLEYNTQNKYHKKQSIAMCRTMLCEVAEQKVEDFDKFEKKDDVADSFNQAFEWMCTKNMIDYNLTTMRNNVMKVVEMFN